MSFEKKTLEEVEDMSDDEVRNYIKARADYVNSIEQEEGESYTDFLDRKAKLLGWGDGNDVGHSGGMEKGAGEAVLYRLMEYSRDVGDRDGFITLFAEDDDLNFYTKYGFDSKQGESNCRILMNSENHISSFMKWFEANKI